MGNAIDRFSFRFRFYIYRGIRLLLADCQGVPATILLCCAIDLLAKYRSGMPDGNMNKKKYTSFLRSYFPPQYNPNEFYALIRCGLVHGFNMENHYAILCRNEPWAKNMHLKEDTKSGTTIINPFVLFDDVNTAFKKFITDVRRDMSLQKLFFRVHRVLPLTQQQISWRKVKPKKNLKV